MPTQPRRVVSAVTLAGSIVISACAAPNSPRTFTANPPATTTLDNQRILDGLTRDRELCIAAAKSEHQAAFQYYNNVVMNSNRNGKFDGKYKKEFLSNLASYQRCAETFYKKADGLMAQSSRELGLAYWATAGQRDRELAAGNLSLSRYRQELAESRQKLRNDIASANATREAAARQRAAEQARQRAAEQAAEESRQAEIEARNAQAVMDAENEEDTTTETTAAGFNGVFPVPAVLNRSQASGSSIRNSASTTGGQSRSSQSQAARQTTQPVSRYQDATSCATISRTSNPDVMNIGNRCSEKITVWMSGEYVVRHPGSTAGYTTLQRSISYACFNQGSEDICMR